MLNKSEKITKNKIWFLISKKINKSIHKLHIISVLNILIDEIIKDLKEGKKLNIPNLGIISLNDLKPKKIISVVSNNLKFAQKTKALRFKLSKKISNFIRKSHE